MLPVDELLIMGVVTLNTGSAGTIAAPALRECTGPDDIGDGPRVAGDSALRLGLAYLLAQLGRASFGAAIRLMPDDHPWTGAVGGTFCAVNDHVKHHRRMGMVARCGHRPKLVRNLWAAVAVLAVALVVSDALAIGPVDLGIIPDAHVGLHRLLGLPWWDGTTRAQQDHAHLFNHPLPWASVWPRRTH
jgi:hypothetical protein